MTEAVQILCGDSRAVLRGLPADSVHCAITSPPYWGLRAYGTDPQVWGGDPDCDHEWGAVASVHRTTQGDKQRWQHTRDGRDDDQPKADRVGWTRSDIEQGNYCTRCGAWRGELGLEPTLGQHLDNLVEVFRQVRRVLRPDGTLWLNYGDCYATQVNGRSAKDTKLAGTDDRTFRDKPFSTIGPVYDSGARSARGSFVSGDRQSHHDHGGRVVAGGHLKNKDLVGMAWRVALALQADGWWLRSDIVWHKPNPMPESIKDRPTRSHEYLFLLAKSERYFYDAAAIMQPSSPNARPGVTGWASGPGAHGNGREHSVAGRGGNHREAVKKKVERGAPAIKLRNARTVWAIATEPFSQAHFATFPQKLVTPCILAGTSAHGCCETCGAPWKRVLGTPQRGAGRGSGNKKRTFGEDKIAGASHVGRGFPWEPTTSDTAGWQPTCACGAGVVPCVVMDPFGGAGTVGLVAAKHGRRAILIELNPDYVEMTAARLRAKLVRVAAPRAPRVAQLGLFAAGAR